MAYRIFNMRTDVNACESTWVCTDKVRESALKVDSGRKISCRTVELNLPQWHAGPALYQPSYIPTHFTPLLKLSSLYNVFSLVSSKHCFVHAVGRGNNRAERLMGKAVITSWSHLGRAEVLTLTVHAGMNIPGPHTVNCLEETGIQGRTA